MAQFKYMMKKDTILLGHHDITLLDRKRSKGSWNNTGKVISLDNDMVEHECKIVVGKHNAILWN